MGVTIQRRFIIRAAGGDYGCIDLVFAVVAVVAAHGVAVLVGFLIGVLILLGLGSAPLAAGNTDLAVV